MIPRRFFWTFDAFIIAAAFFVAYRALPGLTTVIGPGGLVSPNILLTLSGSEHWVPRLPPLSDALWILFTIAPVTIALLTALGGHEPLRDQSIPRILYVSFVASIGGLSIIALSLFALKDPNWSRVFIFLSTCLSGIGLAGSRIVLRLYFLRRYNSGFYARNIALIGAPEDIGWMIRYFNTNVSASAYRLVGFFGDLDAQRSVASELEFLGFVDDLGRVLIHRPIDEVIAVQPSADSDWMNQVIRDCDYFGVTLRIVPASLLAEERRFLETLYPAPQLRLPAVVLTPQHWESDAVFLKRMLDLSVSALALVLLLPVFVAIAIAIKATSPNLSVFYRWRVVGYKGKHFTCYKFATMVANADDLKPGLMALNEMTGPVFKIKDDPRVTPLGKFLRKYSLNELPQLWSVLKGDMSLVGPRPAGPHELERYELWHKRKLSVMPGITCLWQVRGRNAVSDFDDWVKMDLEYIDNWSLWLDLKILFRTAWVVVAGTGS
jgi:exopolysaccharide biosynthesis polyprenyl glycosylphosphotransferase